MTLTASDCLAQARVFRALGLSVIPVPRPRTHGRPGQPGDGKVPILAWRDYQSRLPTDDELVRWFQVEPMNLAVVTGAISDAVVIDADAQDALRWCTRHLPYTPWQTRTARGFHLWYRHPGVLVPNRARLETRDGRLAIDIRGDGGFVIAPGSLHASGAEYRQAGDWTASRDRVPRFWPGWLQRPPGPSDPPRSSTPRSTGPVLERARAYVAAIPQPEIGAGSDTTTLCIACRLVRGFALSATEAADVLWDWAGRRPGWTRAWIERKVAHAERYGTEPIGGLR